MRVILFLVVLCLGCESGKSKSPGASETPGAPDDAANVAKPEAQVSHATCEEAADRMTKVTKDEEVREGTLNLCKNWSAGYIDCMAALSDAALTETEAFVTETNVCAAKECAAVASNLSALAKKAGKNDPSLAGKNDSIIAACTEETISGWRCQAEATTFEAFKACPSSIVLALVAGSESLDWEIPKIPGVNDWYVSSKESRMDETVEVNAMRSATEEIEGSYGKVKAAASVRCSPKGKVEFIISFGQMIDDDAPLRIKFDDGKPSKRWGSRSTDYEAIFLGKAKEFVKEAAGHKTMLVEFEPFRRRSAIAEFDISGLDSVMEKMPACFDATAPSRPRKANSEKCEKLFPGDPTCD